MNVFDNALPSQEVINRVRVRRDILRNNDDIKASLDSPEPSVIFIDDPAIPIPVAADDDAAAKKPVMIPLLLRPQVTVGDPNMPRSIFGAISRFAESPSVSDTPTDHNPVMKGDNIIDNDPDDEYDDYVDVSDSTSKMPTTQTLPETGNVYMSSHIFLTGCMGNGKSYVMRDLAVRSISKYPNIRVAYIPDCRVWSQLGDRIELLKYLVRALWIAFALDESWAAGVEYSVGDRIGNGTNDLGNIINMVDGVCQDIVSSENPIGLQYEGRLLLCIDNYDAASAEVRSIVVELVRSTRRILAVIATRGNQPITDIRATTYTISSYYSPSEARAILDWTSQSENNVLPDEIDEDSSDRLFAMACEYTWLNPRDIAYFFTPARCNGGMEALENFAYDAVIAQGARDIGIRQYLEEVARNSVEQLTSVLHEDDSNTIRMAYFCLYHSLRPTALRFRSSSHPAGVEPTSPFFQIQSTSIYGESIGNNLLAFVSPRVAEYVFGQLTINVEDMIKTTRNRTGALQTGQDTTAQTHYKMGYALMLHWLHRGVDILGLGKGSKKVHLLRDSYPSFDNVAAEANTELPPGIHNKGMHTYSNTDKDYSSMKGVDFITFSDQGRPVKYYIVGLELSTAEFSDILRVFAADLNLGAIEDDSRAYISQTRRICSGIKQAHEYHRNNDDDNNGPCEVYILASSTVAGRSYNRNDLVNRNLNITLHLLNADNL
ncbi:hypothetical protein GGI15_004524 [Coemansia interrupta]|uniref:Uncharacterized protein n=1 Tax=Coemansia interrupta TaxID=1126814 RepID=A0A9W8H8K5_9FUNG|nr:hypothetical protein GGI15_004524 [Coemansia interrupta]